LLALLLGASQINHNEDHSAVIRPLAEVAPSRDPFEAFFSIYGQRFPWLVLLDKGWAKSSIIGEEVSELEPFGWWFISDKFNPGWSLFQLLEAAQLAMKIDPSHLVFEKLARIASEYPKDSVNCLALLVTGAPNYWDIFGWEEHARAILEIALKNSQARESAIDLIHQLGALGYLNFRDLLGSNSGEV
jgi:hypothetical protein